MSEVETVADVEKIVARLILYSLRDIGARFGDLTIVEKKIVRSPQNLKEVHAWAMERADVTEDPVKDDAYKEFAIWSEGYACNEDKSRAMHHGNCFGKSFEEACENYAQAHGEFAENFNRKEMTYWGCSLFDNEFDARVEYG